MDCIWQSFPHAYKYIHLHYKNNKKWQLNQEEPLHTCVDILESYNNLIVLLCTPFYNWESGSELHSHIQSHLKVITIQLWSM